MPDQPNNNAISCIILAGGEGKRFNNKDKGLVLLNDKPLIQHIIEGIRSQVDDIVISANRNHSAYKQYSKTIVKDNNESFQGPLSGISACIPKCLHEWILVIPCDIPFLPNDLVERLHNKRASRLSVAKAYNQRQLIFIMHKSLQKDLDEFIKQDHRKAMSWIELQNPDVVLFEDEAATFLNINTPEELSTL